MRANEIASLLAGQVESVVAYLLPSGKRNGNEWECGDVSGAPGKSLRVHLSGTKAGVWSDFSADQSGDLLGLWMAVKGQSLREAMADAMDYLGVHDNALRRGVVYPNLPVNIENSERGRAWLNSRGLDKSINAYRVQCHTTEVDFPSYVGEAVAFCKTRNIFDKKKMRCAKGGIPVLFGWQAIPEAAREVIICEGEVDALSWYEMGYPALSVPNGANAHLWIENEYDRLEQFDKIYVAFDSDQPGREGARQVVERLGIERCLVIDTGTYKDANELLMAKPEAAASYVKYAKWSDDPRELKNASIYEQHAISALRKGLDNANGFQSPWAKHKDKLRFRENELTVANGVNGHGKTQFVTQIQLSAMSQGWKSCVASLEIKPENLLFKTSRQAAGSPLTESKVKSIYHWYDGLLWLFDLVGTAKTKRLLEVFEYGHRRYGIKLFVIDSLLKCGIAEDDYNGQKAFVEALCDFKNKYPVHVILVTHSRKGKDESAPSGKMDVKGTGAITDLADTVLNIWRNKPKEEKLSLDDLPDLDRADLLAEPDMVMNCNKQRNGEWEGQSLFWFDKQTTQFVPERGSQPRSYIQLRAVE